MRVITLININLVVSTHIKGWNLTSDLLTWVAHKRLCLIKLHFSKEYHLRAAGLQIHVVTLVLNKMYT